MGIAARSRPDQLMFAAGSADSLVAAAYGGRPGKNERPQHTTGFAPIDHHVAGPSRSGSCTQIRLGAAVQPSRAMGLSLTEEPTMT